MTLVLALNLLIGCPQISSLSFKKKKNRLALSHAISVRACGTSQSGLSHLKTSQGYSLLLSLIVVSGCISRATYHRRVRKEATLRRNNLLNPDLDDGMPRLHWIDNYAKSYAAASIWVNKETFRSMLWTAPGLKKIPLQRSLDWITDGTRSRPALPPLSMLLDETIMNELFTTVLVSCTRLLFSASFVFVRDVRRIPLKPIATTPEEKAHLQLSSDGLRYIVSLKDLIAV